VYGYSILASFVGLISQAGFPVAQVKASPLKLAQAVAFFGRGASRRDRFGAYDFQQHLSCSIPGRPAAHQLILGVRGSLLDILSPSDRSAVLTAIVWNIDKVLIMVIAAGEPQNRT
jgi:hypothetical protein